MNYFAIRLHRQYYSYKHTCHFLPFCLPSTPPRKLLRPCTSECLCPVFHPGPNCPRRQTYQRTGISLSLSSSRFPSSLRKCLRSCISLSRNRLLGLPPKNLRIGNQRCILGWRNRVFFHFGTDLRKCLRMRSYKFHDHLFYPLKNFHGKFLKNFGNCKHRIRLSNRLSLIKRKFTNFLRRCYHYYSNKFLGRFYVRF
jgi:hypothetical protein